MMNGWLTCYKKHEARVELVELLVLQKYNLNHLHVVGLGNIGLFETVI